MSIWEELGTTPDVIALADQVDMAVREQLRTHIKNFRESTELGQELPISLIAHGLVTEVLSDPDIEHDCLRTLALLYAAALHHLASLPPEKAM